jgi:hypothetical protein
MALSITISIAVSLSVTFFVMLSVVMLNVVMLSVVAPFYITDHRSLFYNEILTVMIPPHFIFFEIYKWAQ